MVDPQPFHVIASNPPYIASPLIESLDRSVRDYEPLRALDGGPEGLDFHRRILVEAPERLLAGGRIFLEIAWEQGVAAKEIAEGLDKWEDVRILKDHAGHDRVLTATKRG
jgi:release factor glutamine methyltransferase